MTAPDSAIRTLIEDSAGRHPGRPAILAPGREPLTYRDLVDLVENTGRQLRALGLGRDATVAAVFPNGPDMASAFIALSACCAYAPLNPAFMRPDFERCLHGLGARALLVEERSPAAAVAAAEHLGVPILRIRKRPEAGAFELVHGVPPSERDRPGEDDTALLLYTSGTTSSPKLVPLSSENLAASARHIAQALVLNPDDRCLNIMPLFHVHGLMAAVLASLCAGASVVCTVAGASGARPQPPGPHGRRPGLADPQPAPLVDVPVRSAAAASAGELSAEAVRSPRRPAHLRPDGVFPRSLRGETHPLTSGPGRTPARAPSQERAGKAPGGAASRRISDSRPSQVAAEQTTLRASAVSV